MENPGLNGSNLSLSEEPPSGNMIRTLFLLRLCIHSLYIEDLLEIGSIFIKFFDLQSTKLDTN